MAHDGQGSWVPVSALARRPGTTTHVCKALVCATLVIAAVLIMAGPTRAGEQACRPDEQGVPVCGEGRDAVRLITDTTSPSGRRAGFDECGAASSVR